MNFQQMTDKLQPSYTAVVLTEPDRAKLLSAFSPPAGWNLLAHHCTINMGGADKGPALNLLGSKAKLTITGVARDEFVMAVRVETDVPSTNVVKHITIGVNRAAGGKPVMSNQLKNWEAVKPMEVFGKVAEVSSSGGVLPLRTS